MPKDLKTLTGCPSRRIRDEVFVENRPLLSITSSRLNHQTQSRNTKLYLRFNAMSTSGLLTQRKFHIHPQYDQQILRESELRPRNDRKNPGKSANPSSLMKRRTLDADEAPFVPEFREFTQIVTLWHEHSRRYDRDLPETRYRFRAANHPLPILPTAGSNHRR